MGAVVESTINGYDAVGFSLLSHQDDADFAPSIPYVRQIIGSVLEHGLPSNVSLNVNIPNMPADKLKSIRVCREAKAMWSDSFEKRIDPTGRPYWWLTGKFECDDAVEGTDEWALANGYVSVVPIHPDYTRYDAIAEVRRMLTT